MTARTCAKTANIVCVQHGSSGPVLLQTIAGRCGRKGWLTTRTIRIGYRSAHTTGGTRLGIFAETLHFPRYKEEESFWNVRTVSGRAGVHWSFVYRKARTDNLKALPLNVENTFWILKIWSPRSRSETFQKFKPRPHNPKSTIFGSYNIHGQIGHVKLFMTAIDRWQGRQGGDICIQKDSTCWKKLKKIGVTHFCSSYISPWLDSRDTSHKQVTSLPGKYNEERLCIPPLPRSLCQPRMCLCPDSSFDHRLTHPRPR